jgi:hypothetical protein
LVAQCNNATQFRCWYALPTQSVREYLALANELHESGQIALVGTSAEVFNDLPTHPLYSPMVVHLNDLAPAVSIVDYMAAPHRIAKAIAEAVARPAVYNGDVEATSTFACRITGDPCPYRKSNPHVSMVQPSKNGPPLDAPGALNEPSNRRILAQR